MKLFALLHDLCIALLVGGLGVVFTAAFVLFDEAPSREVAGQIGNALFAIVAPGAVGVTMLLTISLFAQGSGRFRLGLSGAAVVVALLITLWLTPAMDRIWVEGTHAADGSGLAGEDRDRFMSLHGTGSAGYVTIWLIGVSLLVLRTWKG